MIIRFGPDGRLKFQPVFVFGASYPTTKAPNAGVCFWSSFSFFFGITLTAEQVLSPFFSPRGLQSLLPRDGARARKSE